MFHIIYDLHKHCGSLTADHEYNYLKYRHAVLATGIKGHTSHKVDMIAKERG